MSEIVSIDQVILSTIGPLPPRPKSPSQLITEDCSPMDPRSRYHHHHQTQSNSRSTQAAVALGTKRAGGWVGEQGLLNSSGTGRVNPEKKIGAREVGGGKNKPWNRERFPRVTVVSVSASLAGVHSSKLQRKLSQFII